VKWVSLLSEGNLSVQPGQAVEKARSELPLGQHREPHAKVVMAYTFINAVYDYRESPKMLGISYSE